MASRSTTAIPRSPVRVLTYTFNNPSLIKREALRVLRDGKPSHIHLDITPRPDGMNSFITFNGPGVVGGSLPVGRYTLITLRKKVKVLSGSTDDFQRCQQVHVSRSGGVHGGKKDHGTTSTRAEAPDGSPRRPRPNSRDGECNITRGPSRDGPGTSGGGQPP